MMDQLITDVTENVISQITSKLFPAIAERYDIPIDELLELVNTKNTKKTIRARPKSKGVKPKLSISKATRDIQLKITGAQDQGKVLNVCSGRPLADSTANRKKYQFFDELGIAGITGDTKLTEALKLLGAPSKKEIPVHRQAARARAKAAKNSESIDNYLEDSEEEPVKKSERVVKKSSDQEESESEQEPEEPEEPEEEPVKKSKRVVKKSNEKPKRLAKKSDERPIKRVVKKSSKQVSDDDSEDMDTIVKLSNIVGEEEIEPVKGKQIQALYNSKIKQWWNPDTGFVLKRKGIKNFVVGKVKSGNKVARLTTADLKKCKKFGWVTDLNTNEESEGETSDSDE